MNDEHSFVEPRRDPQSAMTLASGIDVLACFRQGEIALGNKDFSERTGLSPSAVFRLTYTLVQLGFLRKLPGESKYRLGLAVLNTAYPLLASMQVRQLARPLMREFAERVNGAISLVVKDRCQMVLVETSRTNEAMTTSPDIGSSMPMLNTAAGKAWLCHASEYQRNITLNKLRVEDRRAYDAYFPNIEAARHEFLETGCCTSKGQWRKDVYGFSTPLERPVDSMVFILNCGVPSSSGTFESRRKEIVPQLVELARRIDVFLGY